MKTKAGEYTFEEMVTWPDEDLRPVFSEEILDEESWKTGSGLETKTRQEELSAAIAATRSSFQAPPNILDGSTTCWYSPPPSKDLAKKSCKCGLKQQIVAQDDKILKEEKNFSWWLRGETTYPINISSTTNKFRSKWTTSRWSPSTGLIYLTTTDPCKTPAILLTLLQTRNRSAH